LSGRTVSTILLMDNKILLVLNPKEEETMPDGKKFIKPEGWGMPRGRREESDKDDIATAERETQEETGYSVEIDSRYSVEESAGDHSHVAFIGYPVAGNLKINEELKDARWFSASVLWADDPNFFIHSRQRRMAQKLLSKKKAPFRGAFLVKRTTDIRISDIPLILGDIGNQQISDFGNHAP